MEINEEFMNEFVLLRKTMERIADSLEDIDEILEILFLEDEDYEEDEMEDYELLDSDADDMEVSSEDEEVDTD